MARKTRRSDLDAEIQDLYARPLAEFTAARNDLAKRLQKEGKGDDAAEVKSLGKPTASAWAVNRLFQEERERMDDLLAAGARARDALRHTLTHGEAEALRDALRDERELRDDLRRRAAGILGRASQAILDRVGTNLDALALSPAAAEAAERGWLDRDLDPPGFEVLSGLSAPGARRDRRGLRLVPEPALARKEAPARRPEPTPEAKEAPKAKRAPEPKKAPAPARDRDRAAEKRAAEEERRRRKEEAAREREEARLREQLARIEEKAERAAAEEASVRREAERAEKEAAEAGRAAAEAARRAEAAREAAERARQRAERAARELERAEGHVETARQRLAFQRRE